MTEQLVEGINSRVQMQPTISALHFVCGALLAYDAASGRNPFGGLDVERVFAAVELLAERDTLEVSPFVAAWHPAVALNEIKRHVPVETAAVAVKKSTICARRQSSHSRSSLSPSDRPAPRGRGLYCREVRGGA